VGSLVELPPLRWMTQRRLPRPPMGARSEPVKNFRKRRCSSLPSSRTIDHSHCTACARAPGPPAQPPARSRPPASHAGARALHASRSRQLKRYCVRVVERDEDAASRRRAAERGARLVAGRVAALVARVAPQRVKVQQRRAAHQALQLGRAKQVDRRPAAQHHEAARERLELRRRLNSLSAYAARMALGGQAPPTRRCCSAARMARPGAEREGRRDPTEACMQCTAVQHCLSTQGTTSLYYVSPARRTTVNYVFLLVMQDISERLSAKQTHETEHLGRPRCTSAWPNPACQNKLPPHPSRAARAAAPWGVCPRC
jgi:hypothetical protein